MATGAWQHSADGCPTQLWRHWDSQAHAAATRHTAGAWIAIATPALCRRSRAPGRPRTARRPYTGHGAGCTAGRRAGRRAAARDAWLADLMACTALPVRGSETALA